MTSPSPDFAAFWAAYPRKRAKGDAWKAWEQVREQRPPIDAILAKVAEARRSPGWREDGGKYIPYPATWLRGWGWEDEYEQVPTAQAHVPYRAEPQAPADPDVARRHLQMIRGGQ